MVREGVVETRKEGGENGRGRGRKIGEREVVGEKGKEGGKKRGNSVRRHVI